jgi:uncharacterized protein HemX
MAVERFAVISQKEAMQSRKAATSQPDGAQPEPDKDMTSKGIRGFTIWNRGEQVVGGVIGAGALALGALPVAVGAGVWMGWNEAQIRIANRYEDNRQEKKAQNAEETVVFDAKNNAKKTPSKKEFALAA